MIAPTIGRVVWYYPPKMSHEEQPWPALICYVHSDSKINVGGFDDLGHPFADTDVLLLQDGYGNPGGGAWATWMPFQKGQAAKTEQAEGQLAAHVAGDYRARVVLEKKELDERLDKLCEYIRKPIFRLLDTAERERMLRQEGLMSLLSGVLAERIAAFPPA